MPAETPPGLELRQADRSQRRTSNWTLVVLIMLASLSALACQAAYQMVNLGSGPTPIPTPELNLQATDLPAIGKNRQARVTPTSSVLPEVVPPATEIHLLASPTFFPTATRTQINTMAGKATATLTPTALPLAFQQNIFDKVWQTVKDNYLYPDFNGLDWNAIRVEYHKKIEAGLTNDEFYLALDEMIYRLNDDHSVYLSPEANHQEEAESQGSYNYVGVGVLLSAVPDRQRAVVILAYPGSPAETAGLQSRDNILAVDGQPILDTDGNLRAVLLGLPGTLVTLTIQTPGQAVRQVAVTRGQVSLVAVVPHKVLKSPAGKRIGYILLPSFDMDNIGKKVQAALEEMSSGSPLDGLVIDDRQNPGGMDTELERTLSMFIGGTLGHFVSRDEERPLQIMKARDVAGSLHYPLVILVGRDTISFGEIFAGVLQDTGRAYVIGEKTLGNVETLWNYDFDDGSRLWLAHEYFRPLNHPNTKWEGLGIVPDRIVPVQWDEFTVETDPAVIAALNYIDTK